VLDWLIAFRIALHARVCRSSPQPTSRLQAHSAEVQACAFSPFHPHTLVTAGADRVVRVWDARKLSDHNPLHVLKGHSATVRATPLACACEVTS
jgi:WD40 repeat protein